MMRKLPPIAESNSVISPLLAVAIEGNRRNGDTLRQFFSLGQWDWVDAPLHKS